jgi:hypothetical protein
MQIICLIILVFMNGSYLLTSFNMDSIMLQDDGEETEQLLLTSNSNMNFDLTDLLDLDIFDIDLEELTDNNQETDYISVTNDAHEKS